MTTLYYYYLVPSLKYFFRKGEVKLIKNRCLLRDVTCAAFHKDSTESAGTKRIMGLLSDVAGYIETGHVSPTISSRK